MDLPMLAAIAAIVALPTTLLIWRMSHLEGVIDSLGNRIDATIAAGNARADEINTRIDLNQAALNARVDMTQGVIMKMLEKQGK